MKIKIDLRSAGSIQQAIDLLEKKRKALPKQIKELGRRVAEEGAAVARPIYGNTVEVSVVETDKGYKIVAAGRDVAFFEFGAGIYTDPGHALAGNAAQAGLYVYDGAYSEEHAKQYVNWGYWIFGGKKIYGVQPRYALWSADQQMAAKLAEIAKEVFKDD